VRTIVQTLLLWSCWVRATLRKGGVSAAEGKEREQEGRPR
jgi:hypothetical protein